MSASKLNINIEQGATFSKLLTLKMKDGTAFDLTGYTYEAQVRKTAESREKLASFTISLVSTPNAGQLIIVISMATTAKMPYGQHVWDLKIIKSSDSSAIRLLEGNAIVSAQVTK